MKDLHAGKCGEVTPPRQRGGGGNPSALPSDVIVAQANGLGTMQRCESALKGHINAPEVPLQGTRECARVPRPLAWATVKPTLWAEGSSQANDAGFRSQANRIAETNRAQKWPSA